MSLELPISDFGIPCGPQIWILGSKIVPNGPRSAPLSTLRDSDVAPEPPGTPGSDLGRAGCGGLRGCSIHCTPLIPSRLGPSGLRWIEHPPGTPGVHLYPFSPRPPPPVDLLLLHVLVSNYYLQTIPPLTLVSLLTRTPRPSSLGVGGVLGLGLGLGAGGLFVCLCLCLCVTLVRL